MIIKEKYLLEKLIWDTELFNINSASLILKHEITAKELEKIEEDIQKENYEFITIKNENNNENNNKLIGRLNNVFLADINVQFEKRIINSNPIENIKDTIEIKDNMEYNKEIIEIASEVFKYSRFFIDNNLNSRKMEVYAEWTKNAFKKKGKYFCYYRKNTNIIGYIIFIIKPKTNEVILELIAIDKKSNNRGIGTVLLKTLENFCIKEKINKIKVGTQINNIEAQNFYVKNGYKHVSNNSIYHFWNR